VAVTARAWRVLLPALAIVVAATVSCGPLPPPAPEVVAERRTRDSLECGRLLVIAHDAAGRPARDMMVSVADLGMYETNSRGRVWIHAPCGRRIVAMGGLGFYVRRDTVVLSYGRIDTLRRTVARESMDLEP